MLVWIAIVLSSLIACSLITVVLIQPGKGFGAESAQGSGFSGTVFGSSGPLAALRHFTIVLALLLFLATIFLGGLLSQRRISRVTSLEHSEELRHQIEREQAAEELEAVQSAVEQSAQPMETRLEAQIDDPAEEAVESELDSDAGASESDDPESLESEEG